MRHSNTGKSDPQPAPVKRGFFAAAGERLKRAMSGTRSETVSAASLPATTTSETAEGAEPEVTTSVQAKARELLAQDRAHKRARKEVVVESDAPANPAVEAASAAEAEAESEPRARKTSPPPLPWQRTAADGESTAKQDAADAPEATTGTQPIVARAARPAVKRPVRDSKSEALRARLGAAKAALAQAQAKRAAEAEVDARSDSEPEIILEFLDEAPSEEHSANQSAAQPSAADATPNEQLDPQPTAAGASQPSAADEDQTENTDLQTLSDGEDQTENTDLQALTDGEEQTEESDLQALSDGEEQTEDSDLQAIAASAAQSKDNSLQPSAANTTKPKDRPSKPPAAGTEPIRTLTIARVLARQGYYDRSLSIYDALLRDAPDDADLRSEADRVRADKAGA